MAHPIRVCMISESFLPTIGGLQFEVKYFLEALAKQDAEIVFVSRCDGEKFLEKPKGHREFVLMRGKGILSSMLEIYRIIQRTQPDVIHVHSAEIDAFKLAVLKLLRMIKRPIVVTSHGVDIMVHKEVGYGFLTKDKDPEDFANTCINILTNDPLKAAIGENAAEDIKDFDIMKTTEKYIALYKSMAGK